MELDRSLVADIERGDGGAGRGRSIGDQIGVVEEGGNFFKGRPFLGLKAGEEMVGR